MSEHRVIRYTEYAPLGEFVLLEWFPHDSVRNMASRRTAGLIAKRPRWLINIVNIGKVGGHAFCADCGPLHSAGPSLILWFVVTAPPTRRLVEFRRPVIE